MAIGAMIENSLVAAVVSNPRLPDNPIVDCNAAFMELTGYGRDEIIGRNCRFLRGAGTEPELTEQLRAGIAARVPVMVELLNYKRDGTPFRNAVMIAPIFDAAGELEWFLGSQVEIAGAAADETVEINIPELDQSLTVKTDASGKAQFKFPAKNLALWSPEQPKLYDVKLTCGTDSISEPVGFRTVRTQGKKILVNGQPVFLRGICIHEDYPINGGGRVNTPEKAEQLLKWAKELNCNFVRLAHYPHNEDMTRLADKMGILVWSEVPVYWTIDWTNPETYQNAENQLADEIRRDANRASIIIWSLANETPVSEARTTFLTKLAAKARSLDSTRLLSAAMEKHAKPGVENVNMVQDPLADVVDIVAFNQYVGWYDGLPEKCARVSWEIPYDKPVFVSEFGGDARQGRHGDKSERWNEEFQEELYRQTLPMLDKIDGLVGLTPWILVDFRSPKRLLPGIQDGFNRKGLISSEGVKKKAFTVLQEYYQKRAEQPVSK